MKILFSLVLVVTTVLRDTLAVPMHVQYQSQQDVKSSLISGTESAAPSYLVKRAGAAMAQIRSMARPAGAVIGFTAGAIGGGELSRVTDNHWGQIAIQNTVMLLTAALAMIPNPFTFAAAMLISIGAVIFGQLFKKEIPPATSADDFSRIQGYVAEMMTDYIGNIEDQKLSEDVAKSGEVLNQHVAMYGDAIQRNDTALRKIALEKMAGHFERIRESDLVVSGDYLAGQSASHFVLKKKGTNLCFGPRMGDTGNPTFGKISDKNIGADDWYHLYDCGKTENLLLLTMTERDGRYEFDADKSTDMKQNGRYCAHYRDAQKYPGGLLYRFGSCDLDGDDSVRWEETKFIVNNVTNEVIISSQAPNSDAGRTMIACGPQCAGIEIDDKCYFAQNKMENYKEDQSLFDDRNGQCFTTFEVVPVYEAYPAELLRKRLLVVPKLIRMELMTLLERFILGQLDSEDKDKTTEWCYNFEAARRIWTNSFDQMLAQYERMPSQPDQQAQASLDFSKEYVRNVTESANCTEAGASLMDVALANALVMTGDVDTALVRQELVDPLQKQLETFRY